MGAVTGGGGVVGDEAAGGVGGADGVDGSDPRSAMGVVETIVSDTAAAGKESGLSSVDE